ncbi:MAG TPA: F0F1 ATP synthase subunit gamma [Dermatophilaceae bacterium]|nr:F0F1 ATP synthase subunit gamma [Dermatophilaceae bacterium]
MGAQMRVYRQRIRSVQATKKITRAMELMATSRVVRARQRVNETTPYARALTRALSAVATHSTVEHPLTTEPENPTRAGVVIITSHRGLAGAYASSVMKESERLIERLAAEGMQVVPYLVGRKAVGFYRFRHRQYEAAWEGGSSDNPALETAMEISERILADFLNDGPDGVDEVHIVYTKFITMVTQAPQTLRLMPLEIVDAEPGQAAPILPLYEFEPSADEVLDEVLPKHVAHIVFNCLLQSAASELAARQRAMKSATDNAEELIKMYTRLANEARQAEITQEISEIVGGANALADAK